MTELELWVMVSDPEPDPSPRQELRRLLVQFEKEHRVRVQLKAIPWMKARSELIKAALYSRGPDVSELGTTWVSSFVGMNALLPLTQKEIQAIGGPSIFLPQAWQSGSLVDEEEMWAIPWLAGTRVIFYRRDLLEKAGLNEQTAFRTHQQLERTLNRLQASGVVTPWVVPTRHTLNTLHYVTSWVWDAGGDFVTADGKRPVFNQKDACTGVSEYFGLGRYLPQPAHDLDDTLSETLFWQGQVAATIGGHWMPRVHKQSAAPEVVANLGTALVPGVTFIGGSNLVIWKHTRHKEAAVRLIHFLTSPQVQISYSQSIGLLPARSDVLDPQHLANDQLYQVVSQGLKTGRSFPTVPLWHLIEGKLTLSLAQIWQDVLDTPHLNPMEIVSEHLNPLARRLSFILR